MSHDEKDDLSHAFKAARQQFDGQNADVDATLRAALMRVHGAQKKERDRRWIWMPAAAALVATTAFAGVTGRLVPLVHAVMETVQYAPKKEAAPPHAPTSDTVLAPVLPAAEEPAHAPFVPSAAESGAQVRMTPAAGRTMPSSEQNPAQLPAQVQTDAPADARAEAPEADEDTALFAEANKLHFVDKDAARALAAWDKYLADKPSGRFAPEAHYNRALSLVRLGRREEAVRELRAFAEGRFGNYRQTEAQRLVGALEKSD